MENNDERYRSESQLRIIRVLMFLGGHEVEGLAPGEIAKSLSIPPSVVTHDLANLRIAGVAEELPDVKRWRLTPRVPQIAMAMLRDLDQHSRRLDEVQQRYTREPR